MSRAGGIPVVHGGEDVNTPGVPSSPGFPALDPIAHAAIRTAQDRLSVMTRGRFPFPVKQLSDEEKADALQRAEQEICLLCGALHPAPNTPACPRVATFKLNGDGKLIEGSFWPDGVTDSAVETDGAGNVVTVTHHEHRGWDTTRVVFAVDAAEEDGTEGEDEADDVHPD